MSYVLLCNAVVMSCTYTLFLTLNFAVSLFLFLHSLLDKISEYEEAFDKPKPGRPAKGSKKGGLSRGEQKKINEFMSDLKGVVSIVGRLFWCFSFFIMMTNTYISLISPLIDGRCF